MLLCFPINCSIKTQCVELTRPYYIGLHNKRVKNYFNIGQFKNIQPNNTTTDIYYRESKASLLVDRLPRVCRRRWRRRLERASWRARRPSMVAALPWCVAHDHKSSRINPRFAPYSKSATACSKLADSAR